MLLFNAWPSAKANFVDATSETDPIVWKAALMVISRVTGFTLLDYGGTEVILIRPCCMSTETVNSLGTMETSH